MRCKLTSAGPSAAPNHVASFSNRLTAVANLFTVGHLRILVVRPDI
jgi:hypothetical protein